MNINEYVEYIIDCNDCQTCNVCISVYEESQNEIMMDDIWGIINAEE